ncbi:basic amino acid/polyamine antiporter [Vaginisenegalia massiliensis]|uniref:basic amino acid/polyamine antiporter n=1 Tax=Vaginisenegalia massiliensis TaxID=2058294 RepID=UPI000F542764|nr:basic amino acid/polyamine antiporter [Vaginisenegalia massiliensis]
MDKNQQKIGLVALIGIMVSKVVGSGIFNLMKEMGRVASPGAMLIGWLIAFLGMGAFVLVLQHLNEERPDLDSGIFAYAQAGFGDYVGFNSIWAYWISNIIGNAAYGTLFFGTVSFFFPQFGGGENLISVLGASMILWLIHYKLAKGLSSAALLNTVVLIAKIVPILLFIVIIFFGFKQDIFNQDIWGNLKENLVVGSVTDQVKNTMLVTVWAFVGIEGAVVFSGRAKRRSDVGKATLLGFISVSMIYLMVTVLAYGVMSRQELAALPNPAMGYILERFLGKVGASIANAGVMMSVFGAWLSGTMLAQEVAYQAGIQGLFPKLFTKINRHHVPIAALTVTTLIVQCLFFLFVMVNGAYSFFSQLSSAVILIPYLLVVLFQLKEFHQKKGLDNGLKPLVLTISAFVYLMWVFYASGRQFLILDMLTLLPGVGLYIYTRKQAGKVIFKKYEWLILAGVAILFIYGVMNIQAVLGN